MVKRRFAIGIVFIVLAMAGEGGATLEAVSHEGERCLICECAARPACKTSPIRNFGPLQRINADLQIIQRDLNKNIISSACSCPNNPSVSRYRVLLI